MRVAVVEYPGIGRTCYTQLIGAALALAKDARMQQMARWDWGRFSQWILSHRFEMDQGCADKKACATACDPDQRMRAFPKTMNCWERSLHQLAWFAARGAQRATLYDHDTLVGRHIEVLVPPNTYLGASTSLPARGPANSVQEQAVAGILGGLQGGMQGAGLGAAAGPYGALAGFLLGAGLGAAKGALEAKNSRPASAPAAAMPSFAVSQTAAPPVAAAAPQASARAPPDAISQLPPTLQAQISRLLAKQQPQKTETENKRVPTRTTKKKKRKKKKE